MNPIDQLAAILNNPLALIQDATGSTTAALVARGLPENTATQLKTLAKVYYGTTSYTRMQATCRETIDSLGLTLAHLEIIENCTRRVKGDKTTWQLRSELINLGNLSTGQFATQARKITNGYTTPPAPLAKGVYLNRNRNNLWQLKINGEPADIDLLYETLKDLPDPAKNFPHTGTITKTLRPIVAIPLDKLTTVLDATSDETTFTCSDGVTRTSTQIVAALLDKEWGFGLIHPVEGPVDLVRSSRFANKKQRDLATLESLTCAHPDCNQPADTCQVHHIHAWNRGGTTTSSNLTMLCPFHNGKNDDDPSKPKHGRIERTNGTPTWTYPPWHPKA
ncbi:HNH endonuclease signature motif containing protein [Corynebacterium sp. SCR221107]|uniref:HNH endonuclease signature motif containing protein n=1 Tax=Corynebacterium sp. SCR221107 TaxID=3017361 RepID=UPI0022EC30B9|nr:HNH endonuclease signature motif containing protein [Corynebacterium sp. SCR221107]WBT08592.1 HNH endonuclease signature motif containing protein [Corynebacterium sp. SCR221107]